MTAQVVNTLHSADARRSCLEVDSKIHLEGVQQAAAQPPMMMTQSNYK